MEFSAISVLFDLRQGRTKARSLVCPPGVHLAVGTTVLSDEFTQEDYRRLLEALGAKLGAEEVYELKDILTILQRLGVVRIFANHHLIRVMVETEVFEIVRAKDKPRH